MNLRFAAVLVVAGLAGNLCWGQGEYQALMVKQRAKAVSEKNDEQQRNLDSENPVVPGAPAAPSPAPTPAAPPPPQLTPAQQSLLLLNHNLAAIKADNKPEQIESLANALQANAHGASKPAYAALHKLAADLTKAVGGRTMTPMQRGRLEQDIVAVFNEKTMPQGQYDDVIADVPATLKKIGADAKDAAAVGEDLKAIGLEIRKKP